jgi:DNA repair exonuclease SbcCD nuclease subunit
MMAHHQFSPHETGASEFPLYLTGIENLNAKDYASNDYLALGHIHKCLSVSQDSPHAYYPGSPFQMRFGEGKKKTIAILEIEDEKLSMTPINIPALKELVQIKGNTDVVTSQLDQLQGEILIEVIIEMQEFKQEIIDGIRKKSTEQKKIISISPILLGSKEFTRKANIKGLSPIQLFKYYYTEKHPEVKEVPPELVREFTALIEQVMHENP